MFKKSLIIATILVMAVSGSLLADGPKGKKGGGPPPWAPAHGYRAKTRHIYFPAFNVYFDIIKGVYIHQVGTKWFNTPKPPIILKGADFKNAKQIELDLNVDNPQKFNADHKVKYKIKPAPGKASGKAPVKVTPSGNVKVNGPVPVKVNSNKAKVKIK